MHRCTKKTAPKTTPHFITLLTHRVVTQFIINTTWQIIRRMQTWSSTGQKFVAQAHSNESARLVRRKQIVTVTEVCSTA